MNAASLTKSQRLQRVEKFLSDGLFHSTMEIVQGANVCAVNSIISELRANGQDIRCIRQGDIWRYRMIGKRAKA